MTLAEIIAEARRLDERVRVYHADNHRMLVSALNDRANFYATHFPLLVAVAEAAVEMRGWLNTGRAYEGGCPDAVEPRSLAPGHCRCCASIVAFDAALCANASPAPGGDGVREAAEGDVRQLRRLQRAEGLLLDIWDAWHREGHEPTETIGAAIDRLGDWRWNEGYDPYNPPLRPDPRKALAARGGAE